MVGESATRTIILMYHSVQKVRTDTWGLRVSPKNFRAQMRVVAGSCEPARLDGIDRVQGAMMRSRPAIVVTFDDGFADNLHFALPILSEFNIPATVFVTTGNLGTRHEFWWDELERLVLMTPALPRRISLNVAGAAYSWDLQDDARESFLKRWKQRHWMAWHSATTERQRMVLRMRELLRNASPTDQIAAIGQLQQQIGASPNGRATHRSLTGPELRQLSTYGLIEIGGHTVNHPRLSSLTVDEQRREIEENKNFLEQTLQRAVTSFAYPFGAANDYGAETLSILDELGIKRACTTVPGNVRAGVPSLEYPRRGVQNWGAEQFEQRLRQWLSE